MQYCWLLFILFVNFCLSEYQSPIKLKFQFSLVQALDVTCNSLMIYSRNWNYVLFMNILILVEISWKP